MKSADLDPATREELNRQLLASGQEPLEAPKKKQKYGNLRGYEAFGQKYDSRAEADYHGQLLIREKAGDVRSIRRQVAYDLVVKGVHVCRYRSDFNYEERAGSDWVERVTDIKGFVTDAYAIKKKLMLACHGIQVLEIPAHNGPRRRRK